MRDRTFYHCLHLGRWRFGFDRVTTGDHEGFGLLYVGRSYNLVGQRFATVCVGRFRLYVDADPVQR
jgi:hypothetical protein